MTRIELYDTTLRDGMQGEGMSLSAGEKLRVAHRLDELGIEKKSAAEECTDDSDGNYEAANSSAARDCKCRHQRHEEQRLVSGRRQQNRGERNAASQLHAAFVDPDGAIDSHAK